MVTAHLRVLLPLLLTMSLVAHALAADLERQRALFVEAERALKRGASSEFERLRGQLRDYPLYPYLEYQSLTQDLAQRSPAQIASFLTRYADTPLATQLRGEWLAHLARRANWPEYLRFYQPDRNTRRRCHQLTALIATGRRAEALPQVAEIWLHGRSQPRACDPVFEVWENAGYRTPQMSWRRIELAMEAGQWRLANYLGRGLSDSDKTWVEHWIKLYQNPRLAADSARFSRPHPYREAMLSHAVRRLAVWDGVEAMALWQRLRPSFNFSPEQVERTEHYIVRNLERAPEPEAYDFVRSVSVDDDDVIVQEARLRAALLREDWPQVITWIAALPDAERDGDRWTYWLGRAMEAEGDREAAAKLYRQAAQSRGYYGFMAADRAGLPYHLAHTETPVTRTAVKRIADNEGIRRARELLALDRIIPARREWQDATRDMPVTRLKAAAKLAEQLGWHDRAIFTLARTGYWDDLELRFPLAHTELVERNARLHGIDIAWVFAVMRQESAFMDKARSHVGAMGLMQLMPATARKVARDMLMRTPPKRHELFDPALNIALGSAYLKQMKARLGDSTILATAAYNAGPHRVDRWLPQRTLPADIWIELVPFKETRGYLRRVLAYTVIYEKRMGLTPTRLHDRLHPVPPVLGLPDDALAATIAHGAR